MDVIQVKGKVVRGYRVASGRNPDSPFPRGTIEMQKPHFEARGLSLDGYYMGTLNIDISPYEWKPVKPWKHFEQVKWCEEYPAEDFSFFRCRLLGIQGGELDGVVYYPNPATKISQFHSPAVLEILTSRIQHLANMCIELCQDEILVVEPASV